MTPQFPVYIPSKGRAHWRLTMRHLDAMGVPYFVIVEAQEYDAYAAVLKPACLLVLDRAYQDRYETHDPPGDALGRSKGPGPARNFAWDHAVSLGAAWHWVMDDNIGGFYRLNRNQKIVAGDGTLFRVMEDFVLRYTNVAMAGPQYEMFAPRKYAFPPLILNTRIYSCNLIRNDLPFRWRGRYNEDTDLSLRMLKAHWCTVQFVAFLQKKIGTQTLGGGCTAEFYDREGTLPKSQLLAQMHPDVARVEWKFNRWHHVVNYARFRANRLVRRPELEVPAGVNEYGLTLRPEPFHAARIVAHRPGGAHAARVAAARPRPA